MDISRLKVTALEINKESIENKIIFVAVDAKLAHIGVNQV